MSKPKNWPESVPYLKAPLHGKDLTKAQIQALRTKPSSSSSSPSPFSSWSAAVPSVPASATETPCGHVRIQAIRDAAHPAHGQHGLFATQNLRPGQLVVVYLGRVHGGGGGGSGEAAAAAAAQEEEEKSDYDVWLDRGVDVAVDAAREGNEGRFVNDYRGVRERANARFGNVWCERWGEVCVGIWVVGGGGEGGKGNSKGGIKKGEEILVSYGKGFWEERRREQEDGGGGGR